MDFERILEQIDKYPLPKKAGTNDFVFYLVDDSDKYGAGARAFFKRFYPNHLSFETKTLQSVVATLANALRSGRTQSIREIAIVAHGSFNALLFGVIDRNPEVGEFRYVTALSIAMLQVDMRVGQYPGFASDRDLMITGLTSNSRVTIRACNFGQSREGMYGLYSFFGGKANIYAPREYQFFGSQPIGPDSKFASRVAVHEHLTRQHFLSGHFHSPEQSDSLVRAFVDPGAFSEEFELFSISLDSEESERANFERVLAMLDQGRLDPAIRLKFTAASHSLSEKSHLRVIVKGSTWTVSTLLLHDGNEYPVLYKIFVKSGRVEDSGREVSALVGEGKLVNQPSAGEIFPLQLFFYRRENDIWRGKLFNIASFEKLNNADLITRNTFEAVINDLNAQRLSETIRQRFAEELKVVLSPEARLEVVGASTTSTRWKNSWRLIDSSATYWIHLETEHVYDDTDFEVLAVFLNEDSSTRIRRQFEALSYLGSSPDYPGTELAASLDQIAFAELLGLVDHLRKKWRPGNSFLVHQVQQALYRKRKEFFTWLFPRMTARSNDPLWEEPYLTLSAFEQAERYKITYEFNFNSFWSEVKQSNPSKTQFHNDLFSEEDLQSALEIPEAVMTNRIAPSELFFDEPFSDLIATRTLEAARLPVFYAREKYASNFYLDSKLPATCLELEEIVRMWLSLQSSSVSEIEEAMRGRQVASGQTFLDVLLDLLRRTKQVWDLTSPIRMGLALNNVVTLKQSLLVRAASLLPGVAAEGGIATYSLSGAWVVGVLEGLTPVLIAWPMMANYLKSSEQAAFAWELKGKVVAIRQWLRQLLQLTFEANSTIPDSMPNIDVSSAISVEPYYVGHYYAEQVSEHGRYFAFVWAPERMKKGYDEGVKMMDLIGQEILLQAREIVSQVLEEMGLDSCKVKVLRDANLFDPQELGLSATRSLVRAILDKVPKV